MPAASDPIPPDRPTPRATVFITSKNRKDELRTAIQSALGQSVPVEVVVTDDGSSDGTSDMVRAEFPSVRLHTEPVSKGLIYQRNHGIELASAPIVFSMDDDADFSTPTVVEQIIAQFDHPRIAAVTVPLINVRQNNQKLQFPPDAGHRWIASTFMGGSHAMRRDAFLRLKGYHAYFMHQGEEADLGLRLLAAGYVVRLGFGDHINHYESPRRDFRRMDYYGRRNDLLNAWCNVPSPALVPHMLGTTFNGLKLAFRIGRPWHMLKGIAAGWGCCLSRWSERDPVPPAVYRLSRKLKKTGPLKLEEIEPFLPPLVP